MAQRRTLREVKAEKAYQKKLAKKRKRMVVLIVEILILLILLGIGYVMTSYDAIQQMEWFQNLMRMITV